MNVTIKTGVDVVLWNQLSDGDHAMTVSRIEEGDLKIPAGIVLLKQSGRGIRLVFKHDDRYYLEYGRAFRVPHDAKVLPLAMND